MATLCCLCLLPGKREGYHDEGIHVRPAFSDLPIARGISLWDLTQISGVVELIFKKPCHGLNAREFSYSMLLSNISSTCCLRYDRLILALLTSPFCNLSVLVSFSKGTLTLRNAFFLRTLSLYRFRENDTIHLKEEDIGPLTVV